MDIRFVSSLTPEDEERIAPALLAALGALLDQLPFAYTLRIQTSGSRVFQWSHPEAAQRTPAASNGTSHEAPAGPPSTPWAALS